MSSISVSRRAILVLGMHRGGTSALSRAVSLLGAVPPATLMPPGPDNPRGFWESTVIAEVNDAILAAGGSAWNDWRRFDPGQIDPAARPLLERRMTAALDSEFGAAPLLVLKDPRLSRLLPLWQPVLARHGITPYAILSLRHPGPVAASLARRNRFPANLSVLLWLRHMLDAERDTRGLPRAVVSFSALQQDWRATMAAAGAALGIDWPTAPHKVTEAFLDARPPEPEEGPDAGSAYAEVWCRHAWQALRALEQGDATATSLLDRVRDQFDDACRLFDPTPVPPPARRVRATKSGLAAVTLCAVDTSRVPLTARALDLSARQCSFADALLLTDQAPYTAARVQRIAPLSSRDAYSAFLLKQLVRHIDTGHVLIVQWDGYVLDPACWDEAFLAYDFIGARWAWQPEGSDMGNGGFSLRSRRLLEALQDSRFVPQPCLPEDELICRIWRPALERDHGIVFAPAAVADAFSYERTLPTGPTFGFHGLFNLWRHASDAELAALVPALPPDVVQGREFAELTVLCFLHGRPLSLRALAAAWVGAEPEARIRARLNSLLRGDDVPALLRAAGLG